MWLLIPVGLLLVYVLLIQRKKIRRRKAAARAFPADWIKIIEQNVPIYSLLPSELRRKLQIDMNVFLAEKTFSGCAGLVITDEIRVTVAAFACILLLNRNSDYYPNFQSILVYPSTFLANESSWDGLVKIVGKEARLGESWRRGPIVLSWDAVLHGALDLKDGHNVVLHEFAHKLDEHDAAMDGTPKLNHRSHYVSWARVMQKEFVKLQRASDHGRKSVLDYYGATDPVEFFAVLTETFFEKPRQLKLKHPELYDQISMFYCVDPASWLVN